jgi:hypothetical protein
MHLIPSPPEQVTASTDLLFGLLSMSMAITLGRLKGRQNPWKATIWMWMFLLLAVSSFVGVGIHGLDISDSTRYLLWQPLDLSIAFVLGFFITGVVCDLFSPAISRKLLPYLIGSGFVFAVMIFLFHGTYRAFIPYEAVAFLMALGGYSWLTYKQTLAGAGLWAGGALVTIIAAVVESIGQDGQTYFWVFDHNGVSHVIELLGSF